MGDRSTDKLVAALREAGASAPLIAQAESGAFHDYESQSATPIVDLVQECRRHGLEDIAQRAIAGEFDATKEESDEWARSAEGQLTLSELPPSLRRMFDG